MVGGLVCQTGEGRVKEGWLGIKDMEPPGGSPRGWTGPHLLIGGSSFHHRSDQKHGDTGDGGGGK